jgi:hypothetical protein
MLPHRYAKKQNRNKRKRGWGKSLIKEKILDERPLKDRFFI